MSRNILMRLRTLISDSEMKEDTILSSLIFALLLYQFYLHFELFSGPEFAIYNFTFFMKERA